MKYFCRLYFHIYSFQIINNNTLIVLQFSFSTFPELYIPFVLFVCLLLFFLFFLGGGAKFSLRSLAQLGLQIENYPDVTSPPYLKIFFDIGQMSQFACQLKRGEYRVGTGECYVSLTAEGAVDVQSVAVEAKTIKSPLLLTEITPD